jgi:hypothetical protein
MPDNRQQLDDNITALTTVLTNLITAIEGVLNKAPEDFTAEDTALQTAVAAAQAELDKINPPPPPQP